MKVTDSNGAGNINSSVIDNGKEYHMTISAIAKENELIILNKVSTDIPKIAPEKEVLNTPENQSWLIMQYMSKNVEISKFAHAELMKCSSAVLTKLYSQMSACSTPTEAERVAALIGDIGSNKSVIPLVRMTRNRRLADAAAI